MTILDFQGAIKRIPRLSSLFQGMMTILYLCIIFLSNRNNQRMQESLMIGPAARISFVTWLFSP